MTASSRVLLFNNFPFIFKVQILRSGCSTGRIRLIIEYIFLDPLISGRSSTVRICFTCSSASLFGQPGVHSGSTGAAAAGIVHLTFAGMLQSDL